MTSDSRRLSGLIAAAVTIVSILQLAERDWLRGAIGLALAATFAITATGLPERSVAGKWLTYAFLASAFILLGIRLVSS